MKLVLLSGFMGVEQDWEEVLRELNRLGVEEVEILTAPYSWKVSANEGVVFCGYSMGARVAISWSDRPECAGVISISGSPGIRDLEERRKRAEADEKIARRLESLDSKEQFRGFLGEWWNQPVFAGSTLSEAQRVRLLESRLSLNVHELAGHLRKYGPANMDSGWEKWKGLTIPKLAIAGARDVKYTELAEKMGNSRIATEAGHQIPLEQPVWLAGQIAEFFRCVQNVGCG